MGLREICQSLRKLCRSLLKRTIQHVPECNQIFELASNATACDWEKSNGGEPPLGSSRETDGQAAPSVPSRQMRADMPPEQAKQHIWASDIAKGILGVNSGASISNVLVVGNDSTPPLKRMEIHFHDPSQVPAVFNLLAATFQSSGVDFLSVRDPGIPPTDIWLICPLQDRTKTVLSCPALSGEQVVTRAVVQQGPPRERADNRAA
jgi:hypothetical protein